MANSLIIHNRTTRSKQLRSASVPLIMWTMMWTRQEFIVRIWEALDYDRTTGIFHWKVVYGRNKPGDVAGRCTPRGYVQLRLDGWTMHCHRLAWAWQFGYWPETEIDHIDGNRANNRITNLRKANRSQNGKNRGLLASNKSGHTGVRQTSSGTWMASITANGKRLYLGTFRLKEEAVVARNKAERRLFRDFRRKAAHRGRTNEGKP